MNRFRIFSLLAGIFIIATGIAQVPDFTGLTIVLDPGHGGHEGDDRGMPNGFWESESNFTKALWLEGLLMDRGCNVLLTRYGNDDDVLDDPGLSERPAVAVANNADLFISIHSNGFNGSVNYPLTIFNGKTATPTVPDAKVFATILWEQLVTNVSTYWTGPGRTIGDLTLNPSWTSGYGVLWPLNSSMIPGIISEGSFHDYGPEMDRLLNLDYRRQEAYNIYYALVDYFELSGQENLGNISGIIRDTLLTKDSFLDMTIDDAYETVNGTLVQLLETGESYLVDEQNTGYYWFDSLVPGDYRLVFSAHGYFNDTVDLVVNAHAFTYFNQWMDVDRTMPPKLVKYSLSEGEILPCNDPVSFTFSMYMDSASCAESFSIAPATSGSITWDKDYLTMSFQPDQPYETNTEYTVTVGAGSEHQWDVPIGKDSSFTFTTGDRNRYTLEMSYPADQQVDISSLTQFRLVFDAPLYTNSLVGAVSIKAQDGTILSPKGADIQSIDGKGHYYFEASQALLPGTNYTMIIDGSIQDEDKIPLVDPIEIAFTTSDALGDLTIVDEFEENGTWVLDMALSNGVDASSFVYYWKKDFISGTASSIFRYTFTDQNGVASIQSPIPVGMYESLSECGMWIFGDLSGHSIVFEFDNDQEALLCEVDFAGWAYRKTGKASGAKSITGFRVEQNNDGASGGDMYFDMLSQPGSAVGIENKTGIEGLSLYPNPVQDGILYIAGLKEKGTYSIYNMKGSLLQQGRLSKDTDKISLNEASRQPGMVLLKIVTEKGMHTQQISVTK